KQTLTFFASRPYGFDFSSPGTGKTRAHIEVYRNRPKTKGRCLVVCPKTLMFAAWGADIERFAPELTVSFATAEMREEALLMKTDVVVINTDGVKWFFGKDGKLTAQAAKILRGFDHLIIDESTAFKHPTSQRSKAMLKLSKAFTHRYLLTGTPNPNSVMELFHPALI